MAPLSTWELRWFFPGQPSTAIARLFDGPVEPVVSVRTDRYLCLGQVADMGIKLREGRLEIKGRLEVRPPCTLGREACGRPERWVKWSYATALLPGAPFGPSSPAAAFTVAKERAAQKLALGPAGLQPVPLDQRIERGALRELTRVTVGEQRAWTLALEGFPGDDETLGQLEAHAAAWLGGAVLPLAASLSYPAWLATM